MLYFEPTKDDPDYLGVVVRNVAKEPIFVECFKCQPDSMFVAKSAEIEDVSRAGIGEPVSGFVGAESDKTFIWCSHAGWDKVGPDDKTMIELHWRWTSSSWLPQFPVRRSTTVAKLNSLRQLAKAPPF